jgi:hypothetical protein
MSGKFLRKPCEYGDHACDSRAKALYQKPNGKGLDLCIAHAAELLEQSTVEVSATHTEWKRDNDKWGSSRPAEPNAKRFSA